MCGKQAFHHGFFDDALTVRHRKQRASDRVPLDGESVFGADKILPREGAHTVKQFGKTARRKGTEFQIDPLRTAKPDIGAGNVGILPRKGNAPVHGVQAAQPQRVNLLAQQLFQAKQAGCHKFSH